MKHYELTMLKVRGYEGCSDKERRRASRGYSALNKMYAEEGIPIAFYKNTAEDATYMMFPRAIFPACKAFVKGVVCAVKYDLKAKRARKRRKI